jgi:hypothetical protein
MSFMALTTFGLPSLTKIFQWFPGSDSVGFTYTFREGLEDHTFTDKRLLVIYMQPTGGGRHFRLPFGHQLFMAPYEEK